MSKTGIHWFRHGLRLHDNPALFACQDEVERLVPIFIFDGESGGTKICGYNRFRFLLQSLQDLENQFSPYGLHLMCFHGKPHEVIEELIKEWNVSIVSFEMDSEAIWKSRDDLVKSVCEKHNVQVIERVSYTLYSPHDILALNDNTVPNTFEDFKRICIKIGDPDKPKPKIDLKFITSRLLRLDDIYDKNLHRIPDLDFFNKKMEFDEQKVCLFPGGETKALELYQRRLEYEKENFKKGNQNPNLKKPMLFTEEISLSPYIRFGCLSPRKFYWDIKDSYDQNYTGNNDGFNPAEQLLWREYFYQMSFKNCNFHQIDDNPMSYKIPWDYSDEGNYFSKWEEAQTGFPWIDACMRQLKQEGWVHHIGRNSVAIFLTRGALYQSWHRGSKTFLHYLVDADWSVCAGNWNWISCGDPEDLLNAERTFCPVNYAKRCDPKGDFVRKYVKELSNYPLKYLFEPWKAPLHVQEEASCIIGQDYPEPMVDHESAYLENNFKLRQFFQIENSSHIRSIFRDNEVVRPSNSLEYKKFTYEDVLLKPEVDDDF